MDKEKHEIKEESFLLDLAAQASVTEVAEGLANSVETIIKKASEISDESTIEAVVDGTAKIIGSVIEAIGDIVNP